MSLFTPRETLSPIFKEKRQRSPPLPSGRQICYLSLASIAHDARTRLEARMSNLSPWRCVKTWLPDVAVEQRLQRLGFHTFRPEVHRFSQRNGREMERHSSLFPGYLFIVAAHAEDAFLASKARGVAYMLGNRVQGETQPAEIPFEWIEAIRSAGPKIEGKSQRFKKGDAARLAVGKLADLICTIEKIDDQDRAVVKLALLGIERRVFVPLERLQRAS